MYKNVLDFIAQNIILLEFFCTLNIQYPFFVHFFLTYLGGFPVLESLLLALESLLLALESLLLALSWSLLLDPSLLPGPALSFFPDHYY